MLAHHACKPAPHAGARRRAAGRGPGVAALIAVAALALTGAPRSARARAIPGETRARVEALYREANAAQASGEHARAGDRYREVLGLLREGEDTYETRALALADALRAYRQADDPRSLCRAQAVASEYLREARAFFGIDAAVMDGPKTATREREAIEATLRERDLSCETVLREPEPEAEPAAADPASEAAPERAPRPRRSPPASAQGRILRLTGAVSLGAGAVLLTTMSAGLLVSAGAERDGRALREGMPRLSIDDLNAAGFYRRGRLGERVAIGAGIAAGATLITGAVLLVLARRGDRRASASAEARAAVDAAGIGLRF